MSTHITVDNAPETQTVNWMLEDFPAEVKQKCKEHAILQRQTLKSFVEAVLREAVGMPSVLKGDEVKQEFIDKTSSVGESKPAVRSRYKSQRESTKAKPRAS